MALCRVLVGLPDVDGVCPVLIATDATDTEPMVVEVASVAARPDCRACGTSATVHETCRHGRSVSEVADDHECDWRTINRAVIAYGTALVDDRDRIGQVAVLGLDQTAFVRRGRFRRRLWSTQLVGCGQLPDVVQGRDAAPACA